MEIDNQHNRIRAILGVDELDLTDEIIDYPEYFPRAEKAIKKKVSNWESLSKEDTITFESCILYKTAELLIPYCTAQKVKTEQTTHSKVEYFETNMNDKKSNITNMLEELLSIICDNSSSFIGFDIS